MVCGLNLNQFCSSSRSEHEVKHLMKNLVIRKRNFLLLLKRNKDTSSDHLFLINSSSLIQVSCATCMLLHILCFKLIRCLEDREFPCAFVHVAVATITCSSCYHQQCLYDFLHLFTAENSTQLSTGLSGLSKQHAMCSKWSPSQFSATQCTQHLVYAIDSSLMQELSSV